MIINIKIILKKLLNLAKLLKAQGFYSHKIIKTIVIHKNKYFIYIIF